MIKELAKQYTCDVCDREVTAFSLPQGWREVVLSFSRRDDCWSGIYRDHYLACLECVKCRHVKPILKTLWKKWFGNKEANGCE